MALPRWLAILCLLALVALTVRPIAAKAFDVRPDPAKMTIVGLPDGGHYCVVSSACAAMSPASTGIDFPHDSLLLVVAGIFFSLFLVTTRLTPGITLPLASPPPRLTAG